MSRPVAPTLALCLSLLAVVAVLAPATAGVAAAPNAEAATAAVDPASADAGPVEQTAGTITIDKEYRLTPDRPGRIDVRWRFEVPEDVVELRTRAPEGATDVRTDGFALRDGEYVWEREGSDTTAPTLTFAAAVNETTERAGPIGTDGRLLFADAGDWALIRRQPSAGIRFRYRGSEPAVEYTNRTAGPGVIGDRMVFLGPHESATRSAHGQRVRLVVPDAATLGPSREAVFSSVARASDTLRVGDRDPRVLMIAAPTGVDWGVRGLQTGDRDLYVLADEPVDEPDNVWLHEYVHTRQDAETTAATRWTTEAVAEYYAALLTLRQGRIGFEQFREDLRRGTARQFDGVRLADPATWEGTGANYETGALVAGELDRRVRLASDRNRTLQRVIRRMNRQDGPVEGADLLRYVERAGDADVRQAARRFTETTDRPEVWDAGAHEAAFAATPARFDYRIDRAALRVAGPFRNASVSRPALLPDETLLLPVTVSNVATGDGSYELTVTREGEPVATRSGTLAGEANTTETVTVGFPATGTYRLSTGTDDLVVTVSEPAEPAVTGLTANRTRFGGGAVGLTATVTNGAAVPATGRITVTRNGATIADRRVTLEPGGTATVAATARLTDPGTYRFTAGNRSVSVVVTEATPSPTAGSETPGFGPAAAVAALALLLLGLGRDRVA